MVNVDEQDIGDKKNVAVVLTSCWQILAILGIRNL